jgi:hypothetical protein
MFIGSWFVEFQIGWLSGGAGFAGLHSLPPAHPSAIRARAASQADDSAARSQRRRVRLPVVTGTRIDGAGLAFKRTLAVPVFSFSAFIIFFVSENKLTTLLL